VVTGIRSREITVLSIENFIHLTNPKRIELAEIKPGDQLLRLERLRREIKGIFIT